MGPPSRIMSTLAPRSSSTWPAQVGLTRPEMFALGAAIGTPAAARRRRETGCEGTRSAIVSRPAVTSPLTLFRAPSLSGSTSVSGPGQNSCASTKASSPNSPRSRAASRSATCAISGLNRGRPFASKMRATAFPLVASAPRPYTVSVGNATSPPPRSMRAASAIAPSSALTIMALQLQFRCQRHCQAAAIPATRLANRHSGIQTILHGPNSDYCIYSVRLGGKVHGRRGEYLRSSQVNQEEDR